MFRIVLRRTVMTNNCIRCHCIFSFLLSCIAKEITSYMRHSVIMFKYFSTNTYPTTLNIFNELAMIKLCN